MAIQQLLLQRTAPVPFLWLDFENTLESGTNENNCKATGIQFAATDGGDPDAIILSNTPGLARWGNGVLDGNNQTAGLGTYKYVSQASSSAWDFLSNTNDYCVACYVKIYNHSTTTRYVWFLGVDGGDSNTWINLAVRQSGANLLFTHSAPQGTTVLISVSQSIPVNSDWNLVVCASVGGVIYISVNGAASPAGVGRGIGRPSATTCVFGICGGTLDDGPGQLGGFVDHVHGYKELVYNVIAGFTPPTSAPTL